MLATATKMVGGEFGTTCSSPPDPIAIIADESVVLSDGAAEENRVDKCASVGAVGMGGERMVPRRLDM